MKRLQVIEIDGDLIKKESPKEYLRLRKMLRAGGLTALNKPGTTEFERWAITVSPGTAITGKVTEDLFRFYKWLYYPAKWYQFWYPSCALPGGIIAGVLTCAFIVGVCKLISIAYEAIR